VKPKIPIAVIVIAGPHRGRVGMLDEVYDGGKR